MRESWRWKLISEKRTWRFRIYFHPGSWLSFGIHIDISPSIDLHIFWWMISIGRLRDCEISGWQFPKNERAERTADENSD